jgi:hypothetical protein
MRTARIFPTAPIDTVRSCTPSDRLPQAQDKSWHVSGSRLSGMFLAADIQEVAASRIQDFGRILREQPARAPSGPRLRTAALPAGRFRRPRRRRHEAEFPVPAHGGCRRSPVNAPGWQCGENRRAGRYLRRPHLVRSRRMPLRASVEAVCECILARISCNQDIQCSARYFDLRQRAEPWREGLRCDLMLPGAGARTFAGPVLITRGRSGIFDGRMSKSPS